MSSFIVPMFLVVSLLFLQLVAGWMKEIHHEEGTRSLLIKIPLIGKFLARIKMQVLCLLLALGILAAYQCWIQAQEQSIRDAQLSRLEKATDANEKSAQALRGMISALSLRAQNINEDLNRIAQRAEIIQKGIDGTFQSLAELSDKVADSEKNLTSLVTDTEVDLRLAGKELTLAKTHLADLKESAEKNTQQTALILDRQRASTNDLAQQLSLINARDYHKDILQGFDRLLTETDKLRADANRILKAKTDLDRAIGKSYAANYQLGLAVMRMYVAELNAFGLNYGLPGSLDQKVLLLADNRGDPGLTAERLRIELTTEKAKFEIAYTEFEKQVAEKRLSRLQTEKQDVSADE